MVRARRGSPQIAVAYVRASTTDQKLSPDAQRDAITAWAHRQGVLIAAWHADLGVSGSTALERRPALLEALGGLRKHGAGLLVVLRRDRLARVAQIAGHIDAAAHRAGAEVVCADGAGNGRLPADAFMRGILDHAAAYERAILGARTKAALQAKRARNERVGAVPYGFRVAADGIHLQPNPPEQAVIDTIRELAHRLPVRAIADELALTGVVSRVGKPLSHVQVWRILKASPNEGSRNQAGDGARTL